MMNMVLFSSLKFICHSFIYYSSLLSLIIIFLERGYFKEPVSHLCNCETFLIPA